MLPVEVHFVCWSKRNEYRCRSKTIVTGFFLSSVPKLAKLLHLCVVLFCISFIYLFKVYSVSCLLIVLRCIAEPKGSVLHLAGQNICFDATSCRDLCREPKGSDCCWWMHCVLVQGQGSGRVSGGLQLPGSGRSAYLRRLLEHRRRQCLPAALLARPPDGALQCPQSPAA